MDHGKLIIDDEGKLVIPARILAECGLRPGDELTLVEADEGLLLYQHGLDPLTARRWSGLSEDERRQAQAEAERYESLSEAERNRIWGERT
jgi:bifunctional DNA-binding transcriptional regulator/antitoxin component of YhaV-PrlF toxin-antitoxin module